MYTFLGPKLGHHRYSKGKKRVRTIILVRRVIFDEIVFENIGR
jgi:hypothetical protein